MSFLSRRFHQNSIKSSNKDSRDIVFIDSQLPDAEIIAQKVIVTARAIIIGSEDDGVQIISRILHNSSSSEIHIFATGIPGCIYLGNRELSINTLSRYNLELGTWFDNHNLNNSAPKKKPCLCLYGCNLAAGDVGEEFITRLSQITQAKITATVDTTRSYILE